VGKFRITYAKEVLEDDLPKLSSSAKALISRAIQERLTTQPSKYGEPLSGDLKNQRRLRVSKYRIIYKIEKDVVDISAVGIRSKVYKDK
jgi:mRNA interferase RelE/StbE